MAFQDGEEHTIEGLTVATYRQNLTSKAHSKVAHRTGTYYASKLEVTVSDRVDRGMRQVASRTFTVHEDAVQYMVQLGQRFARGDFAS